jgi:phage protein U
VTNVEKLKEKLDEMGGSLRGITLGDNPNVTPEEVAGEILASLEELEAMAARGEPWEVLADI